MIKLFTSLTNNYKIAMHTKKYASLFAVCSLITFTTPPSHAQQAKEKQELNDVKLQIKQQQKDIKTSNNKLREIEKRLKKDDLSIAKTAAQMNKTATEQVKIKHILKKLLAEQKQLKKQKNVQENALAEQLRSAYSSGQHDYLKLLLNQEEPGKVQRTLTYYQYLNNARISSIKRFEEVLNQLHQVEEEQRKQQQVLAALINDQKAQKLALESQRSDRKSTLKQLNSTILSSQQRLNKLEREEQSLIQTLAAIQAKLNQKKSLVGLSKLKRKLKWPVKGKIKHRFGTKKQGYLKWKGVQLSAGLSDNVKAIHNGRVLFADWLKGYGLVIVLDHGGGYMSLYGHNQALLKNIGDQVEVGEPIALAGQSGGQSESSVYFEIRHKGKPVNPTHWCR